MKSFMLNFCDDIQIIIWKYYFNLVLEDLVNNTKKKPIKINLSEFFNNYHREDSIHLDKFIIKNKLIPNDVANFKIIYDDLIDNYLWENIDSNLNPNKDLILNILNHIQTNINNKDHKNDLNLFNTIENLVERFVVVLDLNIDLTHLTNYNDKEEYFNSEILNIYNFPHNGRPIINIEGPNQSPKYKISIV